MASTLELKLDDLHAMLSARAHYMAQVTELQTRGTELLEESRRLKAENTALKREAAQLNVVNATLRKLLLNVAEAGNLSINRLTDMGGEEGVTISFSFVSKDGVRTDIL